ncbi:hypothetical protein AGMMS50239_36480 [Bacteroidia bacterium]|nr:hypothetical protein AGMMS50239_36480 [Bacteroidia bacterium]
MKLRYLLLYIMALALFSCEEKALAPISSSLGKPGVVTGIVAEALSGGVKVTYRIPNTEDILSVKAIYTLSNGRTMEQDVSYFENNMVILGYNDTKEHEIKLYAVNRAQVKSDPVTVKFTPLEPPLAKIARSIEIISAFGGAQYNWVNEDKYPVNIEFFTNDSIGYLQLVRVLTSELPASNSKLRGYDPEMRTFAILVRDNYGNVTDTIKKNLVPFFEQRFDKKKMSIMKLGSDVNFTNWEGTDAYIIDDDKTTFGHSPANSLPATFTIDLGVVAQVSRVVFFNRLFNDSYYSWGNPKDIEIYGRKDRPAQSGDWSEWGAPIVVGELSKPSGQPSGTDTDEDRAYAESGFEFEFPVEIEPLRYIRIKILSTQTGPTYAHPAEVDVFGQIKE